MIYSGHIFIVFGGHMEKKFFCKDRWLGLGMILVAGFFVWRSLLLRPSNLNRDPGPAVYPLIGCAILAICGILLLIKPGPDGKRMKMNAAEKKRFWSIIAVYLFAVVGSWALGIMYTIPICLFIVSYMFSKSSKPDMPTKKRLLTTLIYTVILSAAIYVIYVMILDVTIKNGVLIKMLFK